MGAEKDHLKVTVAKDGRRLDVVAFGEGRRIDTLPKAMKVMFRPSLNEWNGQVSVQLMAEGFFAAPGLEAQLKSESEQAKSTKTSADRTSPARKSSIAPEKAADLFGQMIAAQRQSSPAQAAVVTATMSAEAADVPETDSQPRKRMGFRMR